MKLRRVKPKERIYLGIVTPKEKIFFICIRCSKTIDMQYKNVYADLDGKAFTDFYCEGCKEVISHMKFCRRKIMIKKS